MPVIPLLAFTDNYIWAIPDQKKQCFDCVDPGEATPVIDYAHETGLRLRAILITHHHNDHVGGLANLLHMFPEVQVYGPYDNRIQGINFPVSKNQIIDIGENSFQVLSTPGHTKTHISYYEPKQHWLFCGDTLFSGGCGRVFDGSMIELYKSLRLYKNLPDETHVYCAHEYTRANLKFGLAVEPTNTAIKSYLHQLDLQKNSCSLPSTIGMEKEINPFLRVEEEAVKLCAEENEIDASNAYAVFSFLRDWKDSFKSL